MIKCEFWVNYSEGNPKTQEDRETFYAPSPMSLELTNYIQTQSSPDNNITGHCDCSWDGRG